MAGSETGDPTDEAADAGESGEVVMDAVIEIIKILRGARLQETSRAQITVAAQLENLLENLQKWKPKEQEDIDIGVYWRPRAAAWTVTVCCHCTVSTNVCVCLSLSCQRGSTTTPCLL